MSARGPLRDDLLDAELIRDPHPHLARLRHEAPVHYAEAHRAWLVTAYDDVVACLLDTRLSSNRIRPLLERLSGEQRAKAAGVLTLMVDWMVVADPPEHSRLRRLATRAFHPRRIGAMERRIGELVGDTLDAFIASGERDIVAGVAFPLPAAVISELIGAPVRDAERFKGWSDDLALVAFGDGGEARDERHARAERSILEMLDYFGALIARARAVPGDDMISALLAGERDDRLSDEEIAAMCALMLFAGHETTTSAIASAVHLLLAHPDQRRLLYENPRLVSGLVEEVLRYEGAIKVLHRWAPAPLELRGTPIGAGERVLLVLSAANRDPARFRAPDRFDITRSPNPHLAFGRSAHACIGAMLARLETRLAIAGVLDRLPGLRSAAGSGEPHWAPTLASRSLIVLDVEHDAPPVSRA